MDFKANFSYKVVIYKIVAISGSVFYLFIWQDKRSANIRSNKLKNNNAYKITSGNLWAIQGIKMRDNGCLPCRN